MSEQRRYQVVFYPTEEREGEVQQYLEALPAGERAKCARLIEALEQQGPNLRPPKSLPVEGLPGVKELRTRGKSAHRFYYVDVGANRYVVLVAHNKKTNKIPRDVLQKIAARQKRAGEMYGSNV